MFWAPLIQYRGILAHQTSGRVPGTIRYICTFELKGGGCLREGSQSFACAGSFARAKVLQRAAIFVALMKSSSRCVSKYIRTGSK